MARLYLIRHAQSANNVLWNGTDFGGGRTPDPEITETGHRQAASLAEHLAHPHAEPRRNPFAQGEDHGFNLSHLYCSLMTRSVLTAEYIAKACGLELQAQADVFEKHGIFETDESGALIGLAGPGRDYFSERFPQLGLPEGFNDTGWWNRPAEDEPAFLQRMHFVVTAMKKRLAGSDDRIALVAHGDFIDQFVNELMGVGRHQQNYDSDWDSNWTIHNTSISRFDFIGNSHNAVYLNRIDHLANDLVSW